MFGKMIARAAPAMTFPRQVPVNLGARKISRVVYGGQELASGLVGSSASLTPWMAAMAGTFGAAVGLDATTGPEKVSPETVAKLTACAVLGG
mmetsp:Transcript_72376/g.116708  ORF Transcript_72376/g.116708 Transcript_72376/m.116708 type:complete len:92 (-) Transcript_72376:57-332(-)